MSRLSRQIRHMYIYRRSTLDGARGRKGIFPWTWLARRAGDPLRMAPRGRVEILEDAIAGRITGEEAARELEANHGVPRGVFAEVLRELYPEVGVKQ